MRNREKIDREFWTTWLALNQTLQALREAVRSVQLEDRVVLLGTERGIEPPLSVYMNKEESMLNSEGGASGKGWPRVL